MGDIDSDANGTMDCEVFCPKDSTKTECSVCGCNVHDTDLNGNGMLDCQKPKDSCPNECNKYQAGYYDAEWQIPIVIAMEQPIALMNVAMTKIVLGVWDCGVPDKDNNEDGLADCKDICSEDPLKTEPRACGCGIADTDMDGNKRRIDCNDLCPIEENPSSVQYGYRCPTNVTKMEAGTCCHDVTDDDMDRDGVIDCNDRYKEDATKTEPSKCGCGISG